MARTSKLALLQACSVVSVEHWAGTLHRDAASHNAQLTSISVATKLNLKTVPYSIASLLSECFYAQFLWISSLRLAISSYFEVQLRVALLS